MTVVKGNPALSRRSTRTLRRKKSPDQDLARTSTSLIGAVVNVASPSAAAAATGRWSCESWLASSCVSGTRRAIRWRCAACAGDSMAS